MKPSTLQSWKPRIKLTLHGQDSQTKMEAVMTETQQFQRGRKSTQQWLQSTDVSPAHPNSS